MEVPQKLKTKTKSPLIPLLGTYKAPKPVTHESLGDLVKCGV